MNEPYENAVDTFAEFMKMKMRAVMMRGDGRSLRPWEDFGVDWLESRLEDELKEYRDSHDGKELVDVANICCFLWMKHIQKVFE